MTRDEALTKAASALEHFEKKVNEQAAKLASFEKKQRCEKLAELMIEKSIIPDEVSCYKEKVASLMKEDDLDSWEKAVNLHVGGLDLGNIDDSEKVANASGLSALESLIVNDD